MDCQRAKEKENGPGVRCIAVWAVCLMEFQCMESMCSSVDSSLVFSALPILTSGIQSAQLRWAQFVFPGLEDQGGGERKRERGERERH